MKPVNLWRNLSGISLRALWGNRLRSFLTLLGLIIGVSSLILVMTIIQGANDYVADKIANLGTNVFKITKLANISEGIDEFIKSFRRKDITWENYEYLQENLSEAQRMGATLSTSNLVRFGNDYLESVSIEGETANMIDIGTREIADGRFFNDQEQQFNRRVCVIGWDIRDKLFPALDPLGRYLKIGGVPYQIIGECKAQGSVLGQSQDSFVIIPLSTFFKEFGRHRSLELYVQTATPEAMPSVMDEARMLLRILRHRSYDMEDDFTLVTSDTTLDLFRSISGSFFMVFLMLTAIAAIVGGIVIMNIMLVSVSERIMEIGVRRAVGATRRHILQQFMLEALILCSLGGVLGVGVGFAGAALFAHLAGMPAGVKLWVAVFGVVLSSGIGIFFGIYPSWKAARLDPVVALQSDR